MAHQYMDIAATPSVRAAQAAMGSEALWASPRTEAIRDRFGPDEAAFIAERDSFFMATVSETGWPYVQHRGGPQGFVRVLDEQTLAFADYRGNRQYISLGNLSADDRASLILVDYAARRRLKIYAHVETVRPRPIRRWPRRSRHPATGPRWSGSSGCGWRRSTGTARSTSCRALPRRRSARLWRRSARGSRRWRRRMRRCGSGCARRTERGHRRSASGG